MKISFYKGSWERIATQFYENNQDNRGLEYSIKLVKNIFAKSNYNIFSRNFLKLYQTAVSGFFYRKTDKHLRLFLKNYKKLSKYTIFDLILLYTFPDFLTYIFSKAPSVKIPHINLGCSSIVRIYNNSIEHGRNLDYFGGNVWAENHEIVVLMPENFQKSINILSRGFFSTGITSINESMLSFSIHMLYTSEINFYGKPILSILFQLVNGATSIDDVRIIISKAKTITGWGILVCDHKNSKAHIFELTGKNFKEMVINDDFAYVNMYFTELKNREFLFSYAWIKNNFSRLNKLKELLEIGASTYEILSNNSKNLLDDNIANNFTISSAVINAEKDEIAVADNIVPASIGNFKKFSINALLNGKILEKGIYETKNFKYFDKRNHKIIVDAYDTYLINGSLKELIKHLETVEDSPLKNLFLAICNAKIGKVETALSCINSVIECNTDSYRKASFLLLKAMFLDVLKKRKEALEVYKEIVKNYNYPDLTFFCLRFFQVPCKKEKFKFIDINLFLSHYILL